MKAFALFRRELGAYLASPAFYGVLFIFLLLSGYFFYTDLSFYHTINFKGNYGPMEGLWSRYFSDLRFVLMLSLPLITMRLFAEEKKLGTFELLTTYPLRDLEILAGKYLAGLAVLIILLAATLVNLAVWLALWGSQDLQPLWAGYLGLLLLGCALLSCGLFISSLTENQAVAGLATLGLFVLFWFLTWNELMASERVVRFLARLSLFDRLQGFFRGVIDSRDLVFFVLFTGLFLFLTLRVMETRFWRGQR